MWLIKQAKPESKQSKTESICTETLQQLNLVLRHGFKKSELCEDFLGGRNRLVNVFIGVRQRRESCFILRRRQVDTTLEHHAVPLCKLFRVALGGVREAGDRALAEEEAEHPGDVAAGDLMPCLLARIQDPVDQPTRYLVQVLVLPGLLEDLERLDAGCHREGVAAERPRLIHGPGRCDHLHDVLAAAVGPHREAAPDDLAHGRHVGRDAEVLLGPAVGDAEAGHDLVEHQQRAVLRGELAEALQELHGGRDEARVADHRLQNDSRDVIPLQQGLNRLQVVVLRAECCGCGSSGDARRIGETESRHAGASLNQE
mmetsp:Transcript_16779/g.47749  ORF Transcript_16779/g.47749 Transcript_16779/m.47749 type:complete len:314 (+) Transcript_16779:108-1049(+)